MMRKREFFLSVTGIFLGINLFLGAEEWIDGERSTGLIPFTEEEVRLLEKNQVTTVLPNKIGARRMQKELEAQGRWEEIPMAMKPDSEFLQKAGAENSFAGALPRAVDNSQLPCFPPVGSQNGIGACTAWGTTYYLATHEIGLARGFNNKKSNTNVLSPKWTYNMINGGQDHGSGLNSAFFLLAQNGAVTFPQFPFDEDYRSWDTKPADWMGALSYRLTPMNAIAGANQVPQDLNKIKQALANGHVLCIGVHILSWQTTKIKSNPDTQNLFVGQEACKWSKAPGKGAHVMTVVGYNDDVWIDVNDNGKVDEGEMGAFLICNSWGPAYANRGFVWVSYDAFLSQSKVPNMPEPAQRIPAAGGSGSFFLSATAKAPNYKPSLVAKFDIGHVKRDQIKLSAAISDTSTSMPTVFFNSGALVNQGGPFAFDGQPANVPEYGRFPLDLTDLVVPGSKPQRFYFIISDNLSGEPTMLRGLKLVDLKHNQKRTVSTFPATVDNQKVSVYVDYQTPSSFVSETSPSAFHIECTSPISGETVSGIIPVTVGVSDSVQSVTLSLDSNFVEVDTSAPFFFLLDTEKYANGLHELALTARGTCGKAETKEVPIHIQN